MTTVNVNVTETSFNPSTPYECDDVNTAELKIGTSSIFMPTFMTDVGEYVATWNFTYTFPEQVDTGKEPGDTVMCTGVTTSETELISRNFTVVSSTMTPTTSLWGTATASFSAQPTGEYYTFVLVSGSGQRIGRSGLVWVTLVIVGSLGTLLLS
ncbi:hypothetical protein DL93DRAFT_2091711 [Clavulina sp. PMI_390]|nr:hypothetical protein DL93DRAFT_2091711 [Clavulina sp. PMI_390]